MSSQYIAGRVVVKKDGNQCKGGWYNEHGKIHLIITICSSPVSVMRELSDHWLVPQFLLYFSGHWMLKSVSQGPLVWHFYEKQICVSHVTPVAIQSRMLTETA